MSTEISDPAVVPELLAEGLHLLEFRSGIAHLTFFADHKSERVVISRIALPMPGWSAMLELIKRQTGA